MNYNIIWLEEAELTVAKSIDYIVQKWGNEVLHEFLCDVEVALQKIKQNPFSYPLHKSTSNVRKYKINKRIILYYKIIGETTIELLTFWNTYQNPENLKL